MKASSLRRYSLPPIFSWARETYHTISVTTYHPIGWGMTRIRSQVKRSLYKQPHFTDNTQTIPTLLVHGALHNSSAFFRLEKTLHKTGFTQTRSLELFTSVYSLQTLAEQLKQNVHHWIKQNALSTPLCIVAHSLGGIVVRIALLDAKFAQKIGKVVFLGTPHQGALLPRYFRLLKYSFSPKSLQGLTANNALSSRLLDEPLPGKIQYWNLRGQLDLVTPLPSTFLPHVPNLIYDGVGHAGLLSSRKVIETIVEILHTPNYIPPK